MTRDLEPRALGGFTLVRLSLDAPGRPAVVESLGPTDPGATAAPRTDPGPVNGRTLAER